MTENRNVNGNGKAKTQYTAVARLGESDKLDDLRQLVTLLGKIESALVATTDYDEVIGLRTQAEMLRKYAAERKLGLEVQNRAAKIKLQTERKIGTALAEMKLPGGNRKSKYPRGILKLTLQELGISPKQSSAWQREASLSVEEFEAFCQTMEQQEAEISTAALLRFLQKRRGRPAHRRGRRKKNQRRFRNSDPFVNLTRDESTVACTAALAEMKNHLESVETMFAEICDRRTDGPLKRIEKNVIPRYLREALERVDEIQNILGRK